MRIAVSLDPDTEALVRRRMLERGISFTQALNDAIREGNRAELEDEELVRPAESPVMTRVRQGYDQKSSHA